MSIYSEHAHGLMSDEDFKQAVADEEWLYKCRTARYEDDEEEDDDDQD